MPSPVAAIAPRTITPAIVPPSSAKFHAALAVRTACGGTRRNAAADVMFLDRS
jgi:hypothetical protein